MGQDRAVDEPELRELIEGVQAGSVAPDAAVDRLRRLPFADLDVARIDHHRYLRQGIPEAVYGPGKSVSQCVQIVGELLTGGDGPVLLTRADEDQIAATVAAHDEAIRCRSTLLWRPRPPTGARVLVATAGTADLPVADEAAITLAAFGLTVDRLTDVGVAGLHRLLASLDALDGADAVIVVAGMEGALVSVIGGLTGAPVVAVPTSTGYGASFEGITALLAMLSSCAAGVSVVGIDNGFGAACAISRILRPDQGPHNGTSDERGAGS